MVVLEIFPENSRRRDSFDDCGARGGLGQAQAGLFDSRVVHDPKKGSQHEVEVTQAEKADFFSELRISLLLRLSVKAYILFTMIRS